MTVADSATIVKALRAGKAGGPRPCERPYGLSGADPATLLAVTAVLLATSVAAIAVPALKATRIDPVVALRYE